MRPILALLLALGLSACAAGGESPTAEPPQAPASSATPTPAPTPAPPGAQPDASATEACAEVRAGIDAFNAGDYSATVDHFRLAVPLARDQARREPSQGADDLVEAVTYYAELAPRDYPRSALSSEDFARFKAVTLGQCRPVGVPVPEGSPEPPDVTT